MLKPAKSVYPLCDLIAQRWSPRAFGPESIEAEKVCSMLEAARWAPSCFGEEPWRFVVGCREKTPETYKTLQSLLVSGNAWALNAPLLILSVAKLHFDYDQSLNRHAFHDVGLAVGNLTLQAQSMGLFSHQMGGFNVEGSYQALEIPRDLYEPVAMIALGYPVDSASLTPEVLASESSPRKRHPLQEIAFSTTWGQSYPTCFT
jgi:nitroreductase